MRQVAAVIDNKIDQLQFSQFDHIYNIDKRYIYETHDGFWGINPLAS